MQHKHKRNICVQRAERLWLPRALSLSTLRPERLTRPEQPCGCEGPPSVSLPTSHGWSEWPGSSVVACCHLTKHRSGLFHVSRYHDKCPIVISFKFKVWFVFLSESRRNQMFNHVRNHQTSTNATSAISFYCNLQINCMPGIVKLIDICILGDICESVIIIFIIIISSSLSRPASDSVSFSITAMLKIIIWRSEAFLYGDRIIILVKYTKRQTLVYSSMQQWVILIC